MTYAMLLKFRAGFNEYAIYLHYGIEFGDLAYRIIHNTLNIQLIILSEVAKAFTLRPRQNGRYFPEDIFKCIFLNENVWISIKLSLKIVHKGPINNIPA